MFVLKFTDLPRPSIRYPGFDKWTFWMLLPILPMLLGVFIFVSGNGPAWTVVGASMAAVGAVISAVGVTRAIRIQKATTERFEQWEQDALLAGHQASNWIRLKVWTISDQRFGWITSPGCPNSYCWLVTFGNFCNVQMMALPVGEGEFQGIAPNMQIVTVQFPDATYRVNPLCNTEVFPDFFLDLGEIAIVTHAEFN